eukprot:8762521-Pyramimonas_sp.AAC.1
MHVVGSGLHCLQEVSSWPSDAGDEFDLEGWLAQRAAGSPCAILVPSGLGDRLRWTGSRGMHSLVLIGSIGIISSYFS